MTAGLDAPSRSLTVTTTLLPFATFVTFTLVPYASFSCGDAGHAEDDEEDDADRDAVPLLSVQGIHSGLLSLVKSWKRRA